jgi:hypothetical protein
MTTELKPFNWIEFDRLWGPSQVFVARISSVRSSASSLLNPAASSLGQCHLTEEQDLLASVPIQDAILGIITHSLFDIELWVVPPTSLDYKRGPKTNKWLLEVVKRINNVFFMKAVRQFPSAFSLVYVLLSANSTHGGSHME